jgi:hypothetical protein
MSMSALLLIDPADEQDQRGWPPQDDPVPPPAPAPDAPLPPAPSGDEDQDLDLDEDA